MEEKTFEKEMSSTCTTDDENEDDGNQTPEQDEFEPTQPIDSESQEYSESVWGRLIPVSNKHDHASLNQVFEFRDNIITLGRDDSNDCTLKCPNVSGRHCTFTHTRDNDCSTVFLEDTSTNGTWIDKKKLNKSRLYLDDGCEIVLVPGSKKRKRKKLSYFFHLENANKRKKLANRYADSGNLEAKYYIINTLGQGAFSTVKLVQDRQSTVKYALKCIDRKKWKRISHATKRDVALLDEVNIMKKANHENIVKVYEYFEEDDTVNVILDYCGGGDMLEYIQDHGAYSSEKGRKVFKQLVEAVDYLHGIKIAHRDLKPDNILFSDKEGDILKLSDFGISREQNASNCGTIIGTPLYQAPEVQIMRTGAGYDGFLADYWSLGIILYVMLVAAPPVQVSQSNSRDEIVEMAKTKTLPWYDEPVAETAKDLIYRLLQIDPKKRILAKDIYLHPWMCGYDKFEEVPLPKPQLVKSATADSKEEEEEEFVSNAEPSISPTTKDITIEKKEQHKNAEQKEKDGPFGKIYSSASECLEENDVAMKALNVCNSDSIVECNRNKNMNSYAAMSTSESQGSNSIFSSSASRKRKMDFSDDDDDDDLVHRPPAKRQKSDPNGLHAQDMNQITFGTSSTSSSIKGAHSI